MYDIKQSTALTVPVFAHDVSGDAVTGLIDAGFTKRISKNGAAFAAMTVTITELENGWYSVPLSTSHTDTNGIMSITLTHGSAKQINLQFRIQAKLTDDLNDVAATDIVSGGAINTTTGAVDNVTLVATTTTNTDMRGTDNALLAASAPTNFGDLSITVTTGRVDVASIGGTLQTANDVGGDVDAILIDTSDIQPKLGTPVADISTDIAGVQSDTDDIQTRLPAALVGGKMDSDAVAVGGSTDGATRLGKATQANVYCTVGAASTTTSIVTSAMDPAAAVTDQFKGKIVTFDANTTTANLRGQSTDITASTALGVLTVTALTDAPVSGDIFVVT